METLEGTHVLKMEWTQLVALGSLHMLVVVPER